MTGMDIPGCALAVVAHPDDVDFRCAGTLAAWTRRGSRVVLLVLTDGSKGSHDLTVSDAEVAAVRAEEQVRAARTVGYDDVRWLGETDSLLTASEEVLEKATAVVRAVQPDVMLSYDPWAPYILHPDHTVAGEIAFKSLLRAREPRFYRPPVGAPPWRTRELWLFAPAQPNHTQDITATFDIKLDAILCHESQYPTEMGFAPGDEAGRAAFCDRMRAMFAQMGAAGGYRYGEAFRRIDMA